MSKEKWAVIERAVKMFGKGHDEKEVAIALHPDLIKVFGLKAGAEAKFKAPKSKAEFEKFEKNIAAYWRQRTQEWKGIYLLPPECFAAYRRWYLGEDGDKLKGVQIKKLCTANEGGTRSAPTDNYRSSYQQFVSDNAKKSRN
jgi:hypothetical protein